MASYIGMSTDKEDKKEDHFLTKLLIPFGAVLIAAIALLTANYKLPNWAVFVVIAYLVIVMIVTVWRPVARLLSLLREKGVYRNISKTYYPYLQSSAVEFGRLIEDRMSNTMISFLQDISGWPEIQSNAIPFNIGHILTLREWLSSIQENLTSNNLSRFRRDAHDLSIIIFHYHNMCVRIQERLELIITQGKVTDEQNHLRQLKREWDIRREGHMEFIRGWGNLTKNINSSLGRVCVDYYEPLKTLV
jgi:hypothetical protein